MKIQKRRLSFFGHVCRLPEDTPVKIALKEAKRVTKKPRGRPRTTFLKQIEKELYCLCFYINKIDDAIPRLAQDRSQWIARTQD